ncbi:MAG: sensor histidine kinase [Roseovarius sp.]
MSHLSTIDRPGPVREAEEFLYIVTHDLKAFARAMCTLPGWIEEDLADAGLTLPAAVAGDMAMLRDYARRLDEALDALTDLSRVGRLADAPDTHDLQALAARHCAALPGRPRLDCTVACEPLFIRGPGNDLDRLFSAVISNAALHHDRDFGTLRIEAAPKNNRIEITVTDDGPGIPPQHAETVFAPLATLRPKSDTGRPGIGLAIARKVVRGLGGDICVVRSEVARGCCLRFDLPRADSPS